MFIASTNTKRAAKYVLYNICRTRVKVKLKQVSRRANSSHQIERCSFRHPTCFGETLSFQSIVQFDERYEYVLCIAHHMILPIFFRSIVIYSYIDRVCDERMNIFIRNKKYDDLK